MKVLELLNGDVISYYFKFKIRVPNSTNTQYNYYEILLSREHYKNIMGRFIILLNKNVLGENFNPLELTRVILIEMDFDELKQISEFC